MNLDRYPRLALFADGTDELAVQLKSFAQRHDLPLLVVHARCRAKAKEALAEFRPDVIHAVYPVELGLIGTYCAQSLQIPLVASWHANLPAQRLTEKIFILVLYRYPGLAQVLLAPNQDILKAFRQNTGLPSHLIPPAVDTRLFAPSKRVYADGVMRIGFAGRLSSETNVRALATLERSLLRNQTRPFRFLVVGDGGERSWLQKNLKNAEFAGDLEGESLARAIARMDVFAHAPNSDVSGAAVMRAMACGVPTVTMSQGAPRFLVEDGVSGFVSSSEVDFNRHVLTLLRGPELRRRMAHKARSRSIQWSWEDACEALYRAYRLAVRSFPITRSRFPRMPRSPIGLSPAL